MTQVYMYWVLVAACYLAVGSMSQALNGHINPLWVESGRELLARQQGLQGITTGLRGGRTYSQQSTVYPGYNPQTSLFYLDSAGRLRPVFLGSGDQLSARGNPYSTQGYINSNPGLEANLYPRIEERSYIK